MRRPTSASPAALPVSAAVEWPKACDCFALDSRRLVRYVIDLGPKWTSNDPGLFGSRTREPLTAPLLLVDRTGGWVPRATPGH